MLATYNEYKKKHPRLTNNGILAAVSLVGCLIAALIVPGQSVVETLSIGTGYVGLALIALTLLIGPLNMLKVRKNPVNIMFRRDAGIWAGITSLLHVGFAIMVQYDWGGTLLGFFFYKDGEIKLNLFGISNYLGLIGALVLVFLLVLSNNHFLKKLKGKLWKNMQRFNYLLFAAAVLHTFTQQANNMRGAIMIAAVTGVTLAVMVAQSIGFVIYRRREQARKGVPAAKAAPAMAIPQSHIASPPISGLGKLKIASAVGMVALLGVGVGVESLNLMNSQATASVSSVASDEVATATSTAAPTATATATTAPTATATQAASTTTAASTVAATTAAATTTPTATATATTVAATATATATATPAATAAPTATATTAASSSKTTVTQPSSSGGTTHTGRS